MSKLFSLFAACLLAISTAASANSSAFTVTFLIQNNSSHTIKGYFSMIPGGQVGQCDLRSDRLVCTPNNQGKIHQIGSFFLEEGNAQAVAPSITNVYADNGGAIGLGSLYPTPVKVVLTNNQWDGKSNLTTTLIITDNPDQTQ